MNEQLFAEMQHNRRLITAILKLLSKNYTHQPRRDDQRIEYLLASAGLGYQEVAELLDKKPDAVRMLLKRNQKNIQK